MKMLQTLFLFSLFYLATYGCVVSAQNKLPALTATTIKRIPSVEVGSQRLEREITLTLKNSTDRTIEVFGRFNAEEFDPSGNDWQINAKTGEVDYLDPEDEDENEKVILTLKKHSKVFNAVKTLLPGEEYTFKQLDRNRIGCDIASMQLPLWFRFSGSKKVRKIHSNKLPLGFEVCMEYPGITIIP